MTGGSTRSVGARASAMRARAPTGGPGAQGVRATCGAGCYASGAGRGVGRARVERGALAFWAGGARAWVGSR